MTEFILDGSDILTKEQLHETLAQGLAFPEWYGGNLDAMYDCLTDLTEDVTITVLKADLLESRLDRYAKLFFRVLNESSLENPCLHIQIL